MSGSALPAFVVAEVVAAAREYLRLAAGVEAALLARVAEAAVLTAEAFCGDVFVARPHEAVLAVAAGWQRLPARPVTAIAGLTALPAGAAPFVLGVNAYAIDIDADATGWIRVADAGAARQVAVDYTAGRAAAFAEVPAPVAQGIVALAAHLFEARDGDAAVAALWRPFRRLRLLELLPLDRLGAGR